MKLARAVSLVIAPGLVIGCAAAVDRGANAVADRTRTTTTTYSAYEWGGAVNEDGSSEEHWTAEFHSGDWHRMEGPAVRVVANCRTHVGFFFDGKTGETTDAPNAFRGACGIYDSRETTGLVSLPSIKTPESTLDRIEITDLKFVRQYAVSSAGAVMGSDWNSVSGANAPCVRSRTVALFDYLPSKEIFTRESLSHQITDRRYLSRPANPVSLSLSGKACGALAE